MNTLPAPFDYPSKTHDRQHGPYGYKNYESYREWLRDEFKFRCVFCLRREQWDTMTGTWHIDHFIPQSQDMEGVLNYDNLLYLCAACNLNKGHRIVSDPCRSAINQCVQVNRDGSIIDLDVTGKELISSMRLDNPEHTEYRKKIILTLNLLSDHDMGAYYLWMKYPDNLPDLSRMRPPGNSQPEGVADCHYMRKLRNELQEIY